MEPQPGPCLLRITYRPEPYLPLGPTCPLQGPGAGRQGWLGARIALARGHPSPAVPTCPSSGAPGLVLAVSISPTRLPNPGQKGAAVGRLLSSQPASRETWLFRSLAGEGPRPPCKGGVLPCSTLGGCQEGRPGSHSWSTRLGVLLCALPSDAACLIGCLPPMCPSTPTSSRRAMGL